VIGHGSSRVRHQAPVDGLAFVASRSSRRSGNDWHWGAACLCEEVCLARMRLRNAESCWSHLRARPCCRALSRRPAAEPRRCCWPPPLHVCSQPLYESGAL